MADKGYHSTETITNLDQYTTVSQLHSRTGECRTIASGPTNRRSKSGPCATIGAALAGDRGKKLQRLRSERVERSFAHVCETGGARRTWLAGIDKVRKRYLMSAAAHNLGVVMRTLFKMGTPRGLQQFHTELEELASSLHLAWLAVQRFSTLPARLVDSLTIPRAATTLEPTPTLAA